MIEKENYRVYLFYQILCCILSRPLHPQEAEGDCGCKKKKKEKILEPARLKKKN